MKLAALETRIDELVLELRQFCGHRTLWLDEDQHLVHAEPDDMLEVRGFRYIATLLRPTREDLTTVALKMVAVELDDPVRRAIAAWSAPAPSLEGNLVPAL